MAEKKYDASSIQIVEGLKAVRKRPGMYIGSTGSAGLHHMLWEIVDNSVDEFLAGHCKIIKIVLEKDNSVSVEDDGRGIPTGIHSSGISAAELIFTKLHAGGKFGGSETGYKVSGGLHGVGSSVVNALSSFVHVDIIRDGGHYAIKFEHGGDILEGLKKIGDGRGHGTKVHFKPDPTVFSHTIYDLKIITNRLRETAFLNKGLRILIKDKRSNVEDTEFKFQNGLIDYINFLTMQNHPVHDPTTFEVKTGDIQVEFTFQYTDQEKERIFSFANNIKTVDGGTHETGFKNAFTKSINEYCNENNIFKKNEKNFEGVELRHGLTAIISVYIIESLLQFEGQTKTKLGTTEAKSVVEQLIYRKLKFWLVENKETTHKIIDLAFSIRKAKEEAKKLKATKKPLDKKKTRQLLSGKLVPAQTNKVEDRELFLVEGDSAGGSAKLGRDSRYQAILPLKGKVINVEKVTLSNIMKNEELMTIISTIGTGIGQNFDIDDLNYGKIIIMTDADTDGAHIQILILTFFHKYMKTLIDKGYVYIALPPLYKVSKKGKDGFSKYLWTDEQLEAIKEEFGKVDIQRYKGLGEMNYDQLWETTMDPGTRTLIQSSIEDAVEASKVFDRLMGTDPSLRRQWIESNIDFSQEDDFNEIIESKEVVDNDIQ